jgi:hypothetical protein
VFGASFRAALRVPGSVPVEQVGEQRGHRQVTSSKLAHAKMDCLR